MKIAYISTSLPNECGIATFNANLVMAIHQYKTVAKDSFIIALSNAEDLDTYPSTVKS